MGQVGRKGKERDGLVDSVSIQVGIVIISGIHVHYFVGVLDPLKRPFKATSTLAVRHTRPGSALSLAPLFTYQER